MRQKIIIRAEYSFDDATSLIKYFVDKGYSVSAKQGHKMWEIGAIRPIDPELEKKAAEVLRLEPSISSIFKHRRDFEEEEI